jgi:hypothetical protein
MRGRRRRCHDIPFHITASSNRSDEGFIERFDRLPQAGLDHAVKLEILTRGDPQRIVPILRGELIAGQVLIRRQHAAGKFGSHHENELLPDFAFIPVILLIDPVEFQEFVVIIGEVVQVGIGQGLSDRPRQQRIVRLQPFVSG